MFDATLWVDTGQAPIVFSWDVPGWCKGEFHYTHQDLQLPSEEEFVSEPTEAQLRLLEYLHTQALDPATYGFPKVRKQVSFVIQKIRATCHESDPRYHEAFLAGCALATLEARALV